MPRSTVNISRRELLAGAGAAALLLEQSGLQAPATSSRTVVFSHTTVVNVDAVQDDVALAVEGDKIAAIGPTDTILRTYPNADVYDGRGKALLPGLINCHAHMAAVLARGFNEDFGFPNAAHLTVQPASLLQGEENTLMVKVAALEAIRTGTTTIVENAGGIGRSAAALAQTGLRCVFAESIRDSENVAGPMSPEGLARSEAPRFSARLREEGLQRIDDLFTAWHGKNQGRISVFPAAALAETASPELLQAVRAFAEKHDLGYTIHLSQSRAEVDFMVRVLDTRRAHLVPAGRIVSAWVHNGQPSDIESSMVDGQFIMRNRKVLTMNEDSIIADADKVGRRIWNKVLEAGPIAVPGRSRRH